MAFPKRHHPSVPQDQVQDRPADSDSPPHVMPPHFGQRVEAIITGQGGIGKRRRLAGCGPVAVANRLVVQVEVALGGVLVPCKAAAREPGRTPRRSRYRFRLNAGARLATSSPSPWRRSPGPSPGSRGLQRPPGPSGGPLSVIKAIATRRRLRPGSIEGGTSGSTAAVIRRSPVERARLRAPARRPAPRAERSSLR